MINFNLLINSITGAVFGGLVGGIISLLFIKRNEKKEKSEKIYAPLLTEFKNNLRVIENEYSASISSEQWNRITQKDHIPHRIKSEIKQNLECFYVKASKSYKDKYTMAHLKIRETIDEELDKRLDKGYTLENIHSLTGYLYPDFIAGKLLNNQSFLKQQLDSVNSQLKDKYKNLDDFFEKNLKLLNQEKEIKEIREERNKVIKHINFIISLLEKRLK